MQLYDYYQYVLRFDYIRVLKVNAHAVFKDEIWQITGTYTCIYFVLRIMFCFIGVDDDVVKLYDLTSLADTQEDPGNQGNPFTVPLGRLLYRVARNMWNTGNKSRQKIRLLLENCLLLLDEEKHSQVWTCQGHRMGSTSSV